MSAQTKEIFGISCGRQWCDGTVEGCLTVRGVDDDSIQTDTARKIGAALIP